MTRHVDLGVFLPVGNNGWIISETAPQYLPTFELNRNIAQLAESLGFEFALSMVKYRGFGGPTGHWDHCVDSMTLTAALAAVTTDLQLYASVAPITTHPALVARMAATIDDISNGRFGINIVAGWQRAEYEQMGMWPGDDFYEYRYDYASEYVEILRELWARGQTTYKGRFFDIDDCVCSPTPAHDIRIVGAGSSPRGRRFVAEHADYQFGGVPSLDGLRESTAALARDGARAGREVGTIVTTMVILGDTDEEANETVRRYEDGADQVALARMHGEYARDPDPNGSSRQVLARQRSAFYGFPVAGCASTVAAHLDEVASIEGIRGIMLTFDDFLVGLERFGREVLPLLDCRATNRSGLRQEGMVQ
jgi:pyrimidine oxygenase